MKTKQLKIVLVCTTVLLTFGASGQEIRHEVPKNWKELNETDYSIYYPETFVLDQSGIMGTRFVLYFNKATPNDLFRENINLMIQDLSGLTINLDNYVKISEEQIKTLITAGQLIESKRMGANSREFQRIIYKGKQGQFDLKWLQFYWVENHKAFVLTLTCKQNEFASCVATGEEIMYTFKIK